MGKGIINYDAATTNELLDYVKEIKEGGGINLDAPKDGNLYGQQDGEWKQAQEKLVNGETIKTLNGVPVLGSGNIDVAPTIGDNGNWFINGEDTGKPSKGTDGKNGADGVSLGEIALVQETGTESGSENKVMSQKAVSTKFSELEYKLIKLVGMGATGIEAGVKDIGDVCYNTQTKLLRMAIEKPTPTSVYVTIPYYDGAIYTIEKDLYIWDGNDLVKITDNSGSININELKYKLIKLVGMGATGIEAGVKKIGDICYNTKTKLLRMAIEEPTPSSLYETIPYYDGAIYTIGQDLYVWNGNDLVKVTGNSGSDGSGQEQEFNDEDCTAAFIVAMKNKAKKIGMNITIEGVAGYPDNQISDAKSCAKMFMCASEYDVLARIWDTKDDITIHSKGSINASHLLHSTVYSTDGQGHYANQLTDYYTVLGGKTGSVNTKMVYGVVVKGKDDTLLVGWVRLNTIESTSINRYKAMKILMDIAFKKQENISEDISTLETQLKEQHVTSAQVLQIPNNVSIYETFDIYNEKYTNYNLYGYNNDTMDSIASNTKILTIMTALDYITDINDLVTMKSIDFVGGGSSANPEFAAGEQFTIRELIFSMVMPSSNSAARALARYIGNILLRDKYIIL